MDLSASVSGHRSPGQLVGEEWRIYASPQTHAALQRAGDELISTTTRERFPISDGIPRFLAYGPQDGKQEYQEALHQLNRLTGEIGWLAALQRMCNDAQTRDALGVPFEYVTDERRARYIELLPLTPESRVLEVGPYFGQHTHMLAGRARAVHALEVSPGAALVCQQRLLQMGVRNVFLSCGGDDCRFPYADASFDCVVMNLVFEWCAQHAQGERRQDSQKRFLCDAHRVLRHGGTLYLSTKNRFAPRYLLGGTDQHAYGMRFGNALPRWLMRLCLALRGKRRSPGLLHSYAALHRMVLSCGFGEVESFWAIPGVRFPDRYVRTDARSIRDERRSPGFVQSRSRRERLLAFVPSGLVKHFTPGLTFLARKPTRPS